MYAAAPIIAALSVQYFFSGICIVTPILSHISFSDSLIYELLATPPLINSVFKLYLSNAFLVLSTKCVVTQSWNDLAKSCLFISLPL